MELRPYQRDAVEELFAAECGQSQASMVAGRCGNLLCRVG